MEKRSLRFRPGKNATKQNKSSAFTEAELKYLQNIKSFASDFNKVTHAENISSSDLYDYMYSYIHMNNPYYDDLFLFRQTSFARRRRDSLKRRFMEIITGTAEGSGDNYVFAIENFRKGMMVYAAPTDDLTSYMHNLMPDLYGYDKSLLNLLSHYFKDLKGEPYEPIFEHPVSSFINGRGNYILCGRNHYTYNSGEIFIENAALDIGAAIRVYFARKDLRETLKCTYILLVENLKDAQLFTELTGAGITGSSSINQARLSFYYLISPKLSTSSCEIPENMHKSLKDYNMTDNRNKLFGFNEKGEVIYIKPEL